ncbi:hypothetical protein G3580_18060 [Nitrogeniibacter mangrovi]|uniref:DUF4148 domain-containing protein n=1 Tax=Nitrogeniibacter mangrovi TaxID=2016596 RepID=A0A6C1BAE2_9RHOO|nr:hypothetical protein [Nitrogeniibacter mangrovi]QID19350.1 hypothetical protein G3580_18060 [Nitrogeniibacter mangrovi]
MTRSRRNAVLALLGLAMAASVGARGPWRADEGNTVGWQLMSPEERIEHQARIRSFTDYDACHAYQLEHHRLMEARAAERGLRLPSVRRDACAHLRRDR